MNMHKIVGLAVDMGYSHERLTRLAAKVPYRRKAKAEYNNSFI